MIEIKLNNKSHITREVNPETVDDEELKQLCIKHRDGWCMYSVHQIVLSNAYKPGRYILCISGDYNIINYKGEQCYVINDDDIIGEVQLY